MTENTHRRPRAEKAFIPFAVLGYPDVETSIDIIRAMAENGADMLELGFPFSDPIADGPMIQEADTIALRNGVNAESCFRIIEAVRHFTDIPVGLLLYYNLILQYGVDSFLATCRRMKIGYVLAADVPLEEAGTITEAASREGIKTAFIVTELTDERRLRRICGKTTGFLYVVTRLGVTGAKEKVSDSTIALLRRLRAKTSLPLFAGFGISKPEHVRAICKAGADGAICGSAIVKLIRENIRNKRVMLKRIGNFVREMKAQTLLY